MLKPATAAVVVFNDPAPPMVVDATTAPSFARAGFVDLSLAFSKPMDTSTAVSAWYAPDAQAFVGTFTDASATLNLQNTIVANNGDFGCFLAPFGAGAVVLNSLGNNVFTDGTCFPIASDQIVADAGLGSLADNGGPTLTHALLAGSPAIDAADDGVCPATDQRGVPRPQGAACDVGAFEYEP